MAGILLAVFISSVCLSTFGFHTVAMAQTMTQEDQNAPSGTGYDPSRIYLTPAVSAASTIAAVTMPQITPDNNQNESMPTPTVTSEPTIIPTAIPTTIPTSVPSTTPTPQASQTIASSANPGGLNADLLFSMSNAFRAQLGLPEFQKNEQVCSIAASRAPEISAEIYGGYMHAGLQARNFPFWITENIISMQNEDAAFNWWVNDPPHRAALVGDYKYSCVACAGKACAQEFTNFAPKSY